MYAMYCPYTFNPFVWPSNRVIMPKPTSYWKVFTVFRKNSEMKYSPLRIKSKRKFSTTSMIYSKNFFSWYLYVGTLFFVFLLIQIFYNNRWIRGLNKFFAISVIFLFGLHTAGLIARWFISGHAPWSDAYESMIYVAWATMLFGLLFGRKSQLTIAATAFVTSMILMIAHWNWMDPAIANLQPVLNSYWLMIHVAVIVGSYGPFALSMIIGIISLILMRLTTEKNQRKLKLSVKNCPLSMNSH